MTSEDYSITESSSSHLQRGQKSNATSFQLEGHHEGSLQVPIPCAVLAVFFITTLIIALVALSVGQYNCPGQHTFSVSPDIHAASCSDDWVAHRRKCYLFSTTTTSWTLAQNSCSKDGATLAVIDSEKDMVFLKRYVGRNDHWIGLKNAAGGTWKWSNGKEYHSWLNVTASEKCAFLNNTDMTSTECEKRLHWICSKASR